MIMPTDNEIDMLTEHEYEILLKEVSKRRLIKAGISKIDSGTSYREMIDSLKEDELIDCN